MRQQGQQNRRGRGRSNNSGRKMQNPLSRNYDSNGPDVKIRGTAAHIAEKYSSLARDALSSGDTVAAENLFQHAEHYNRIIMSAQQQVQADAQPGTGDQPVTSGRDGADAQVQDSEDGERKNERPSRSRNAKNSGNGTANNRRRRRRPNGNGGPAKNGSDANDHDESPSPQATSKPVAKPEKSSETDTAPSPNGALL